MGRTAARAPDAIVDATIAILETEGYDAVTLREVARRARVSLGTIYKRFPTRRARDLRTRDTLITAALEAWIDDHVVVVRRPPSREETLHDGLMRMLRGFFGPMQHAPRVLEAYHRVTGTTDGARVHARAFALLAPVGLRLLEGLDPTYVDDVHTVLGDACDAAIAHFAEGRIEATEILPRIERTVFRLTSDNASLAARAPVTPPRSRPSADRRRPTASAR